ncbi:addiction module antidote protein, CopG/Arc/MetJ family, partial [mine drainage metagenome]
SMNISLPTPLKRFVDEQIAAGRYSSASEYVRDLIRGDEKRGGTSASRRCCWKGWRARITPDPGRLDRDP